MYFTTNHATIHHVSPDTRCTLHAKNESLGLSAFLFVCRRTYTPYLYNIMCTDTMQGCLKDVCVVVHTVLDVIEHERWMIRAVIEKGCITRHWGKNTTAIASFVWGITQKNNSFRVTENELLQQLNVETKQNKKKNLKFLYLKNSYQSVWMIETCKTVPS